MLFVGYGVAIACSLAIVVLRLRDHRTTVAIAHVLVASGFTAALPDVYRDIGALTGWPNLATLLVYSSIALCLAYMQQSLLTLHVHDVAPGRGVWTTGAAVAVMTVLFCSADTGDVPHPLDFDATYGHQPQVAAFEFLWWSTYTAGLLRLGRTAARVAVWTPLPWLRLGARVALAGCVVAWHYALIKAIAWAFDMRWASVLLAPAYAVLGALGIAAGFSLPAVPRWTVRLRARRDIYPLWRALSQVSPSLAEAAQTMAPHYRWLISTHDLLRALRPHVSPYVARRASELADHYGLSSLHRHAVIEAARIHAALRAAQRGHVYRGAVPIRIQNDDDRAPEQGVHLYEGHPGGDPASLLQRELADLCRIGRVWRQGHPLITDLITDTD